MERTPRMSPGPVMMEPGTRHVFLHGFTLLARIGVFPAEYAAPQRIVVDVDLLVDDTGEAARHAGDEDLAGVVDYSAIAETIIAITAERHHRLVETLAERIAATCLRADPRVRCAQIRVGKPDIFTDIAMAGVTVLRRRTQ